MGPHNREIPLAALSKSRGRSKAGKPGTRALRQKSHKPTSLAAAWRRAE